MDGNRLPAVTEHFDSSFKVCNRLHKSCNRLPKEIFKKYFPRVTFVQMVFRWLSKVYLYMTWKHEFKESFHCPKSLILSKD